jgi:hypothetical protein
VRLPTTRCLISLSVHFVNHSKCTTSAYFPTVLSFMCLLCLRADSFRWLRRGGGLRRGNGKRLAKKKGYRECLECMHRYACAYASFHTRPTNEDRFRLHASS